MFAYCGSRERSLDRLTDLAREAGFALGTVTQPGTVPSSSSCRTRLRRKPVDVPHLSEPIVRKPVML
jgi:hypothetical protein